MTNFAPVADFDELLRRLALDLPGLVTLLYRASAATILRGVPVTVRLPAGQASISVPHGMGVAHVGALVLTATEPSAWAVAPATDPRTLTFSVATAPVADATYNLWVF